MSRVFISPEFPASVSRVFGDILRHAACEAADSPDQADIQILNKLPSSGTSLRTLVVQHGDAMDNAQGNITFLRAPFTLSRLMMELHSVAPTSLPPLSHDWQADGASRSFTHDTHATITLTEREWDMCLYLLQQEGVVSQEQLLQDLWGYEPGVESHTVETHMYRLRQKLEQHKTPPCRIETTEGGYKASA